jgi:hypothetical protein
MCHRRLRAGGGGGNGGATLGTPPGWPASFSVGKTLITEMFHCKFLLPFHIRITRKAVLLLGRGFVISWPWPRPAYCRSSGEE